MVAYRVRGYAVIVVVGLKDMPRCCGACGGSFLKNLECRVCPEIR